MAAEAGSALGLSVAVLAESPDDAACAVAAEVVLGSPLVEADLRALAERVDVITFDHEQVDLTIVRALIDEGVVIRPGLQTLEMAVDKAHMRAVLVAGRRSRRRPTPCSTSAPGRRAARPPEPIARFGDEHGWPLVLKTARGGYDGKGVWPVDDMAGAAAVLAPLSRHGCWSKRWSRSRPSWPSWWPAAPRARPSPGRPPRRPRSAASAARCSSPGRLPAEVVDQAAALGRQVAEIAGAVGVLAVELFWSDGVLMVNEIAARPHNSGHWTIEGAVTSQFENHLRAVLDLPLGSTAPQHAQVANVNIFGGPEGTDPVALLPCGLAVEGAHVHLYGKGARPGRKLGHVTVCGDDADVVRGRAPGRRRWPWARPSRTGSTCPGRAAAAS